MMVKQIEQLSMSIFLYVCVNSTIYRSKNIFFFVYTEKKSDEWFGCRREKRNFKHFSLLLVQKYSKRTAFWSFDRSKSMQWIRKYDVYFIFMLNNLNFRFNLNVGGGGIFCWGNRQVQNFSDSNIVKKLEIQKNISPFCLVSLRNTNSKIKPFTFNVRN